MEIDLKDPRIVTWGELDPTTLNPNRDPYQDPAEPVIVSGHPLFRYDEAKAKRLVERCRELSGVYHGPIEPIKFRVSPDLAYMHTPVKNGWNVNDFGFSVKADRSLPENSVQLWSGD